MDKSDKENKKGAMGAFFNGTQTLICAGVVAICATLFGMNGRLASMETLIQTVVSNQNTYVTKDVAEANRKARDKEIQEVREDIADLKARVNTIKMKN